MWNSKREFRTGSDYRCPKGHIIDSRCFCVVLNSRDGIRPGGVVPWGRMGFRRHERGASPPANPCVFVVEHHVGWANRSTGTDGVVPHRSQTLIPSSSSTTSDGRIGARGRTAWCLTARKPLFLRRRAPRRMGESEHGDGRRGASPPANPCFFVVEHHAGWANRSTGTDGVVLHRPQTLVSSSSSTTPLISSNRTIPGTRPGFPEFPSPPKNEKCRPRCCSSSTLPTFPFPLSISRDCPSLHIEGTVSILS